MHTVELLEEAIALAQQVDYEIRYEWLAGSGGGACELKGRKCIFLDLAVGPADHLDVVLEALRREAVCLNPSVSEPLRGLLQRRRAA
ncbi:MAG TPA: hypothetical protein EYP56_02000 [Planctomycetaceae bacterium]|nr:hypothetical protein [Planctomycetaceae bacterium]HIQ19900.1 hypothetical protein [Planctomycetota bacterium]